MSRLRIAIEGCCHGELDAIYAALAHRESTSGSPVDLLLICGDFECLRDEGDLDSMAVPAKYRHLNDFHKYINGEKVAPVLTIFIGGNHEASNVLQSLYYGGWVAPNIYFLGFAGVVNFCGLRIGGISGIFDHKNYYRGHFERPPYDQSALRSVYHIRQLEIYRLMSLNAFANRLNFMLSHDWPRGIWEYGNKQQLLRFKPFLRQDMETNNLGCQELMDMLVYLKPQYWCSAHLHVKFLAHVPHMPVRAVVPPPPPPPPPPSHTKPVSETEVNDNGPAVVTCAVAESVQQFTTFISLDKVMPRRSFLEIVEVPVAYSAEQLREHKGKLYFDSEWLSILKRTNHLLSTFSGNILLPNQVTFSTQQEIDKVTMEMTRHYNGLEIPPFTPEMLPIPGSNHKRGNRGRPERGLEGNIQTDRLLNALQLEHIWTVPMTDNRVVNVNGNQKAEKEDPNEIDLDAVEEEMPNVNSKVSSNVKDNDNGNQQVVNRTTTAVHDPSEIDLSDL